MIKVNGYKAFHGVMKITPLNKNMKPFTMEGDWLYVPIEDFWYKECYGCCLPAFMCQPISEAPKTCKHNYIEKQVEKGVTVQVLECADCGDVSVGWCRE